MPLKHLSSMTLIVSIVLLLSCTTVMAVPKGGGARIRVGGIRGVGGGSSSGSRGTSWWGGSKVGSSSTSHSTPAHSTPFHSTTPAPIIRPPMFYPVPITSHRAYPSSHGRKVKQSTIFRYYLSTTISIPGGNPAQAFLCLDATPSQMAVAMPNATLMLLQGERTDNCILTSYTDPATLQTVRKVMDLEFSLGDTRFAPASNPDGMIGTERLVGNTSYPSPNFPSSEGPFVFEIPVDQPSATDGYVTDNFQRRLTGTQEPDLSKRGDFTDQKAPSVFLLPVGDAGPLWSLVPW